MLKLKRLFRPKKAKVPKSVIERKPITERQITVATKSNVPVSGIYTKHKVHKGGKLRDVNRDLVIRINKLHNKQKRYGKLSKREKTLLAEYTKRLEMVASTREGTKSIYVED